MDTRTQIAVAIATGCNGADAAKQAGVEPSYVSKLMTDDRFCQLVIEIEEDSDNHEIKHSIDTKYDRMEHRLLSQLEGQLQFIDKPLITLKAISTINAAKRRTAGEANPVTVNNNTYVSLNIPAILLEEAHVETIVNSNNEIISVDGREMTTMTGLSLSKRLEAEDKEAMEGIEFKPDVVTDSKVTAKELETADVSMFLLNEPVTVAK